MEIKDPSRTCSWSNNQSCPIMAKLDRILVSIEWDIKYPLAQVTMLPKGVSNHKPLKITFGEKDQSREPIFRFEKWWLEIEGFADIVRKSLGD
jgi:hypothetical protein